MHLHRKCEFPVYGCEGINQVPYYDGNYYSMFMKGSGAHTLVYEVVKW